MEFQLPTLQISFSYFYKQEKLFEKQVNIQQLAAKSTQVIWITSGALMDVETPTLSPVVGLVRTLR